MSEKGLTTISLKKINRSKVYQYIYKAKASAKLKIVQDLQMGLSTVSQNLNLLEEEGLIERNGYFESTGGRKAHAIRIVPDFKISIGIGILKKMFHITIVDLYGNALCMDTFHFLMKIQMLTMNRLLLKSRILFPISSMMLTKYWASPLPLRESLLLTTAQLLMEPLWEIPV